MVLVGSSANSEPGLQSSRVSPARIALTRSFSTASSGGVTVATGYHCVKAEKLVKTLRKLTAVFILGSSLYPPLTSSGLYAILLW